MIFTKSRLKRARRDSLQRGMSYVELIVVLGIFAVITGVALYNYRGFQYKVDIKNLGTDIALKIVEAQKGALSGRLSTQAFTSKPAYGVYFDLATPTTAKSFTFFADYNNDKIYNDTALETVNITKGNSISRIDSCSGSTCTSIGTGNLAVTFKRPDTVAYFSLNGALTTSFDSFQIIVSSPSGVQTGTQSTIKVYASGRIQVN